MANPKSNDRRYGKPCPRWTEREDEILRRNYPKHGTNMGKWDVPLKRTRGAILSRAHNLGVFIDSYELEPRHDEIRRMVRITCDHLGCTIPTLVRELRAMLARGDL